MIVTKLLIYAGLALANPLSDLERFAAEVPTEEVTKEAVEYILNETNEAVENLKSHYTLALFENQKTGRSWYILDGYFELSSGKILFLDFVYRPESKTWWPVENYRKLIPAAAERFLLQAKKICNPFDRNFIGIVRIDHNQDVSLDRLGFYLRTKFQKRFSLLDTSDAVYIIDNTRDSDWGIKPVPGFTLSETNLIASLKEDIDLKGEILMSGRGASDDEMKITYAPVTASCK